MKKIIIHIIGIVLSVTCLITLTYGWWISGYIGDGAIIKSAKISSIITVEKGIDFNHDGNLDLDSNNNEIYERIDATTKSKEQVLILDLSGISPTEVYTFRITVQNKGDVSGYVYANLFEDIDFKDGLSIQEEMIKFMSIKAKTGDGEYSNKKYFNKITEDEILFGGTDDEMVEQNKFIQIVFQITFENIDDLINDEVCIEADRFSYQNLQGKTLEDSFKFLDISLSSHKPEN